MGHYRLRFSKTENTVAGSLLLVQALILLLFQTVTSSAQAFKIPDKVFEPVVLGRERFVITAMPDGKLLRIYPSKGAVQIARVREDHTEHMGQDLLAATSEDGLHWSEPFVLRKDYALGGNPTPFFDKNGELHIVTIARRQNFLDIWHTKSFEGRKKWTTPKPIFLGYGGGGPIRPVQLPSGRLIMIFDYRIRGQQRNRNDIRSPGLGFDAFTYHGPFVCTSLYSDDNGETWKLGEDTVRAPVPDPGTYGANEPLAIKLKEGRMWMLMRTQMGRQYESFSTDDGLHWTEARPSRFISSDSPAELLRLRDGRLLILWNNSLRFPYAYGGRQVLHAAISDDEGKTWVGFREVHRDLRTEEPAPVGEDFGTGYTRASESLAGNIIVASGQLGSSEMLTFSPEWLYEKGQRDDFADGTKLSQVFALWSKFGAKGVELRPHPDNPKASVLSLSKVEKGWTAEAVRNFPSGRKGNLRIKLMLREGSKGAHISLTDHFSIPADPEAEEYSLFHLAVGPDNKIGDGKLIPGRWHVLDLTWNFATGECLVFVDGKKSPATSLSQRRAISEGISYVRLRVEALDPLTLREANDPGFMVEYLEVKLAE